MKFTEYLDKQIKIQEQELEEAKIKSLLKHKLKKLKKEHGYISKSMLTKKEREQMKKEK